MNQRLLAALFLIGIGLAPATAGAPPGKVDPDPQVVFEVRVVTVPAEPGAVLKGLRVEEGGVAFLSDAQLKTLFEVAQADRRTNILQTPKITTFDGEPAEIRMCDRREFVTSVEASQVRGSVVLVPKKTVVDLGQTLTVCGRVSADQRTVSASIKYANTRLASEMIPLVPVTTQIVPAGGGQPIPFTQFLQVPEVRTVAVEKTGLVLPAGGHAVITGPMTEIEERVTLRTPILSDLPVIGRLCTSVGYGKRSVRTLLVVTARVIVLEEERPLAPLPRAVNR